MPKTTNDADGLAARARRMAEVEADALSRVPGGAHGRREEDKRRALRRAAKEGNHAVGIVGGAARSCDLCALGFAPFKAEGLMWHQVNGRDPFRCAADQAAPQMRESQAAWLVELFSTTPTYFAGVSSSPEDFPFVMVTNDHLEAVRFARKEDAERLIKTIGMAAPYERREDIFHASEHSWGMEIMRG